MSLVNNLLANLRGNGVLYIVCIVGIVGAFKLLADYPKQKKFVLTGTFVLMGSSILGAVVAGIVWEAIVGGQDGFIRDFQRHAENINTASTITSIIHFLAGLGQAAGVASILYAVFLDKFKVSAKSKRRSRRDDDDDEDDRPRRRRSRDDEDEDRPRRRSRRDDDD